MSTTIAEQVSRLVETLAAQPANEVMGAFSREQAEPAASGVPEGVIEVGATLPDAKLIDPHGATTTLYEALGDQVAVLFFYRGAWCPYCNIALNTYQAELVPELERRGVTLVAISPQAPNASLSTQEKNELTLTVLSDPANQVAKAIGILTAPSAEARAAQLELGLDLTAPGTPSRSETPITASSTRPRLRRPTKPTWTARSPLRWARSLPTCWRRTPTSAPSTSSPTSSRQSGQSGAPRHRRPRPTPHSHLTPILI